MSITGDKVITNAKKMYEDGVVYAYGFKYKKITTQYVKAMAKLYPSIYTAEKIKLTLAKVGKIGVDCSGFVCKAAKISNISSTGIQNSATQFWPVSDPTHISSGMYIWRKGHVGLLEVDNTGTVWVIEARSTILNLRRTKFSTRGKSFTYYGKIKGVTY